jgi:acid phosphatase class B
VIAMSPDFLSQWEHIIDDVDKQKIPIEFIKKLVIKLHGKRQQTINIKKFLDQGLSPEQIEEAVSRKLTEYDDMIQSVEFVLNIESIAETVQPETNRLLKKL